jgi:hypothetical protein
VDTRGYIRELNSKQRWHAECKDDFIYIHFDNTRKRTGMHFVENFKAQDRAEKTRIKNTFQTVKTEKVPRTKFKNIVAPNVRELQQQANKLNHVPKWRIWYNTIITKLTKKS